MHKVVLGDMQCYGGWVTLKGWNGLGSINREVEQIVCVYIYSILYMSVWVHTQTYTQSAHTHVQSIPPAISSFTKLKAQAHRSLVLRLGKRDLRVSVLSFRIRHTSGKRIHAHAHAHARSWDRLYTYNIYVYTIYTQTQTHTLIFVEWIIRWEDCAFARLHCTKLHHPATNCNKSSRARLQIGAHVQVGNSNLDCNTMKNLGYALQFSMVCESIFPWLWSPFWGESVINACETKMECKVNMRWSASAFAVFNEERARKQARDKWSA